MTNKLNKKAIILLILITLVLIVLATIGLYARYASDRQSNDYIEAKQFYFTSDKLTKETKNVNVIDKQDTPINLYAYDIDNQKLTSEDEITYNLTIKYFDNNDQEISSSEESLTNQKVSGNTNNTYTLKYKDGASYALVEAKTSSPYKKTIKGKFIYESTSSTYKVTNTNEGYCYLTIMVGSEDLSEVTLNITSDYAADNNDLAMMNFIDDNNCKLTDLKKNTTYRYEFYKVNNSANFAVKESEIKDKGIIKIGL